MFSCCFNTLHYCNFPSWPTTGGVGGQVGYPSTLPLIHYRISSFNSSDLLGCEMNNLKRPLLRTFVSHLPGNLKEDGILQIKLLIPVLQA